MARLNWVVTSEPSPDPLYWNRVLVDEAYPRASLHAAGYQGERIRKIFLNGDIEYRHFYLEGALNRRETSDQLNQRYLRGAMKTGCQAILD